MGTTKTLDDYQVFSTFLNQNVTKSQLLNMASIKAVADKTETIGEIKNKIFQ